MWGTTNLALYLLDSGSGRTLRASSGPGVSRIGAGNFEEVLFERCATWVQGSPHAIIVLSGMVGSTIGWMDAPYLDCPVDVSDVAKHCTMQRRRGHRIYIAPGLACTNALGRTDVMRGEETELLAWLDSCRDSAAPGRRFVCIPGTHCKWVEIEDGRVARFHTSVTGELFDALCDNRVLASTSGAVAGQPGKAFCDGVSSIVECPEYLLSRLFGVRASVVRDQTNPDDAPDFMSGLLVGADVAGAIALLNLRDASYAVSVVGAPHLSQRYAWALQHCGVPAESADATRLAARGLFLISTGLPRD